MNNLFEELHSQAAGLSPEFKRVYETGMQLIQERDEFHADLEAALQRKNELKAYVQLLRNELNTIVDIYMPGQGSGVDSRSVPDELVSTCVVIVETPAQSLNHIKAEVEEETIEQCAVQAWSHFMGACTYHKLSHSAMINSVLRHQ